jgi:hypothetical protein
VVEGPDAGGDFENLRRAPTVVYGMIPTRQTWREPMFSNILTCNKYTNTCWDSGMLDYLVSGLLIGAGVFGYFWYRRENRETDPIRKEQTKGS